MVDLRDCLLAAPLPGFPRLFALRRHRPVEALHIERKAVLPDDVGGQVRGKTKGIVELEDGIAGNRFQAVFLQIRHRFLEDPEARIEGLDEALLLALYHLPDIGGPLSELRIRFLHLVDDHLGDLVEEGPVQPEELPVTRRPA